MKSTFNRKICTDFQEKNDAEKNELIFNRKNCISFQYKSAGWKCTGNSIENSVLIFSKKNDAGKNQLIFNRKMCIGF